MKVVIGYPPLESKKGTPLLSQNRQFQWFSSPTYIYPIVPAQAASLLKKAGYQVVWLDGIAEVWTLDQWIRRLKKENPDLLVIETKTPVIKTHWQIINSLKTKDQRLKAILVGDHVTAFPEESFKNSKVDYILTGGNYDFLLLNLVNHLSKGEKLEPGIYFKRTLKQENIKTKEQKIINTGKFKLNHNLDNLPFIYRELTKWQLYAYKNGNFQKTPGTYIMAGRDCWWRGQGGCNFCSWTTLYPKFNVRSVNNVLDEIGVLIKKYNVKEIMDDSGTFPAGNWLRKFCQGMIKRGYNKKINFSCNMRFGCLTKKDYQQMARAGFRLLLFGLESANQKTIDKLNKGIKVDQVEKELKVIKKANQDYKGRLSPHLTCMVGYPWETLTDAQKTINLTKSFFQKGLIDTLQATTVIPYPGTKFFDYCERNKLLKTLNWDKYDMKQPVIKTKIFDKKLLALTRGIYASAITPAFIIRKVGSVRSFEDILILWKMAVKFVSKFWDFA